MPTIAQLTGEDAAAIGTQAVANGAATSTLSNVTPAVGRTALGVVIGTDVQAYSAKTAALAALTWAADKLAYFTSASAAATADLTTYGRSLIAAANAAAARTLLALGTMATQAASAVSITGGTMASVTITNGSATGLTDVYADRARATVNAVSALDLDCTKQAFTKSISAGSAFTVSNVPAGLFVLTLKLTISSSATPTWFSGVTWPNGATPSWANGTWRVMFMTDDGGSTWAGVAKPFS